MGGYWVNYMQMLLELCDFLLFVCIKEYIWRRNDIAEVSTYYAEKTSKIERAIFLIARIGIAL